MEQDIRGAVLNLDAIMNSIPDAAWMKDSKCRYISANRAFCNISGKSPENITGMTDFDIWPKDLAEKYFSDDNKVLNSGETNVFEEHLPGRDSFYEWVETIKTPLRNEYGVIIGIVGISRNIAKRKENEEKLIDFQKDLRALTLELTKAQEKERRRISIALHDHVCQNLAYCKIKLAELEKEASSIVLSRSLKEIAGIVAETIQYSRSLIIDLSPPVLYELGLEAAIEWLGENIVTKRGMKFSLSHDETAIEMEQELRVLLFQIIREILTNSVKHSKANHIQVLIRKTGQSIMISVSDDGIGFNVPELIRERPNTYGFFSIREQLSHVGGYFNIKSNPGSGTRVNIVVPIA